MIGKGILGRTRIAAAGSALRAAAAGLGLRAPVAAAAGLGLLALTLVALHFAPPEVEAQSAPATPSSVTVTRSGATLTATWDALAEATKYHVTYSADNGKSWTAAVGPDDNHSAATIDITGIDTTKTYIVGVRAGNEHGWSSWRNSAPNHPSGPPARPDYVSVSRADGTLTASWNSIAGADKYHVTYSSDGRQSWSLAADNHTSTSIAISVDNQHTYIVGVRGGKTGGNDTLWGNWRNSPSSAPWVPDDPPPSAPASVTLNRGCDQFGVSWTPVSGATGYDVNVSTNNRKSWKRALSNVTYTSWTFGKWNKNKTYTLAVRARNGGGESGWTNSAAAPPPPCAVGNLRAVTSTTHGAAGGSITTTWDAAERASAYNVNYRADGGEWQRIQSGVSATTHTGTVSSRGGYTVAVQSTSGGGMSQWRNFDVSGWLTAGGISGTGATLTIAGHSGDWYVKETSPDTSAACSSAITGATHDLSTLLGSASYTYTAYSDSGCANAIASATFTTIASTAVPSAPAAPALTTGNKLLTTEWTAPAHNGSAITDYDLRYRAQGTTNWNTAFIQGATYFRSGTGQNNKSSNGATGQALDLGTVSLSGLTVTKLSTGGISNVYRISEPIGGFRLQLRARNNQAQQQTYQARYAQSAPTTSNMLTHGTLLWQAESINYSANFTKEGWTDALPADTHFWITTTTAGGTDIVEPTVEADAARVPSPLRTNIGGLTNGTTYDVQARAVNANGLGAWSPSGTLKVGRPARASAPTLTSGNLQLDVTWTATSGNGSDITDYDLRYSSDGGTTWTDVEMDSAANTARSYTITNLTNDTAYLVQARATNTHGDGLWSPSSASVKAGAPDAPAAPTLASGNATLTATWAAPVHNGAAITGYDVEYSTDGATWSSANVAITLSTRTAVISGLTNDTAYRVRVRATNARATGAWSPAATDEPGRPPAPAAPSLTAGAKQLTVTWTAPTTNGLSITDYDVQYRKSSATDWTDWTHDGTAVSATITGLQGVVTYQVRVRAESSAGDGPWSAAASLATNASVPDTPAAPTLVLGGAGQITVQWIAPHDGGASLTGFKVQYKESSASTWTDHTFSSDGSTTETTISSLTDATKYDAQVRATNSEGDSAWSDTSSGTVGGLSQVTVTVTPGHQQLSLSWNLPPNHGTAITDYDVRYRQTDSESWVRVFDGGTSGTKGSNDLGTTDGPGGDPLNYGSLSLSSVTNESNGFYKLGAAVEEMRVYDLDAYTASMEHETTLSLRTHSSKPSTNIHQAGTELASVTQSAGSYVNFVFPQAWYGPFNANDYFWVASDRSQTFSSRNISLAIDLATTTTSYTLGGLTNGTEYEVQVRAKNSRGESEWSSPVSGTPKAP